MGGASPVRLCPLLVFSPLLRAELVISSYTVLEGGHTWLLGRKVYIPPPFYLLGGRWRGGDATTLSPGAQFKLSKLIVNLQRTVTQISF